MENWPEEDATSTQNILLEACCNKIHWTKGFLVWNYILEKNLKIDVITIGIIVKYFEYKKDLRAAFALINLMKEKNLKPNIVYFTNLIHISFGFRNW